MNVRSLRLREVGGGLNTDDPQHKIDDSQSPDMLNMWTRDGILCKRWGQEYVRYVSGTGGEQEPLGGVHSISPLYEGHNVVHAGNRLYKMDLKTGAYSVIPDAYKTDGQPIPQPLPVAAADNDSAFILFNGLLYFMDGAEIWRISEDFKGGAISDAAPDDAVSYRPYRPLVYINCRPDLSQSTPDEAFNLLTPGFTLWYNGDGTAEYKLPIEDIDDTAPIVEVGGEAVPTSSYAWNPGMGTVTFTSNIPQKGTNNVAITAFKTRPGSKEKIMGCRAAIAFGGESTDIQGGTRVFVMKNPDYPRTYWYSGLGAAQSYGMNYFPDTQYENLLQNNEPITAAAKQGGELIIFKTRSLFAVSYQFDGQDVYYPLREFNATIGCDMPGSVQLIDNNLVFANTYAGVFTIVTTAGKQEENVKPVSGNINAMLLCEPGLEAATSADFNRKYWLCTGAIVYLWDYGATPFYGYSNYEKAQSRLVWFKFGNISAGAWYGGERLYYVERQKEGPEVPRLVRFTDLPSDFDKPIEAWWVSKAFDFDLPDYLKTIHAVCPSLIAHSNSSAEITVSNETNSYFFNARNVKFGSFSWRKFSWDAFTWGVHRYAKPCMLKPKMKKAVYCQVKLYSNENHRDMGISSLAVDYAVNGKIRR